MQLTKSKWRNDPLKFFLFPLPGCPSSEFTKVRIKNRGLILGREMDCLDFTKVGIKNRGLECFGNWPRGFFVIFSSAGITL